MDSCAFKYYLQARAIFPIAQELNNENVNARKDLVKTPAYLSIII